MSKFHDLLRRPQHYQVEHISFFRLRPCFIMASAILYAVSVTRAAYWSKGSPDLCVGYCEFESIPMRACPANQSSSSIFFTSVISRSPQVKGNQTVAGAICPKQMRHMSARDIF